MIAFLETLGLSRHAVLFVIDLAWKSTLLLLCAAIVTLCLRRRSAALRHAVWHWTLVALLLLPAVAWLLPGWGPARFIETKTMPAVAVNESQPMEVTCPSEIPLIVNTPPSSEHNLAARTIEPQTATETDVTESPTTAIASVPAPSLTSQSDAPSTTGAVTSGFVSGVERAASSPRWPGEHVADAATTPSLPESSNSLFAIWAIGSLLVTLPLLVGSWRVHRLRHRSLTVGNPLWQRLLLQAAGWFKLQSAVDLKSSSEVTGPLAGGVWKPFILLPASHGDWPEERSRSVLLHELAHIARRDVLKQWLACLACAVYWMHPLVWLAAWRMRVERERACDDAVLSLGTRPSDYSQHLLDIATAYRSPSWLTVSAMTMARSSQLRDRIERILDPACPRTSPSLRVVSTLAIAMLGMACAVATAGRIIVRDADGNVMATVNIPDGGSVLLEEGTGAAAASTMGTDGSADPMTITDGGGELPGGLGESAMSDPMLPEDDGDSAGYLDGLLRIHPEISSESCAQCHVVDDLSEHLLQGTNCPSWPHGVVISDADGDGVLDIQLSQLYPFNPNIAPQGTAEELYRRLSLDIRGLPPTEAELQSLREREENLKRELMQRIVEEMLEQLPSDGESESLRDELDQLNGLLDSASSPEQRAHVYRLWNELFDDPREAAIDSLIVDPSESISSNVDTSENNFHPQFENLHGFDFRVNGETHFPRSSGLLPESVEQPRGMWQIETVHPRGPIVGMEFSANGRYLAFTNSGVVRIVEVDRLLTGYTSLEASEVQQVYAGTPYHNRGAPLAWEPDASWTAGGWLAVGTCEGTVRLLQTDGDCLPVLQTDDPIVVGVCWSPDAKLIAAAGNHGQVTIWDRSWNCVREFDCGSELSSIDWSPNGTKLLMADHNHGLQIWTPEGEHVRTIETPNVRNARGIWSDDASLVAAFATNHLDQEGDQGVLRIWSSEGELQEERSIGAPIHDLQWTTTNEGSTLWFVAENILGKFTFGFDGTTHSVIDLGDLAYPLTAFAIRDDGSFTYGDATGNMWMRRGGSTRSAKIAGTVGELATVSCSPDGDLIAVCGESSDGTGFVTLINYNGEIETHLRLPARVTGITWSPDGMWFVPILDGEPTRIWKRDGTRLGDLGPGVFDFIAWQPVERDELEPDDGRYIAAASGGERIVFSATNRAEEIEPMPVSSDSLVTALSWNPTGELFFTGSVNGAVSGCNAIPPSDETSHTDAVRLMAWSPNGEFLATACGPDTEDMTVRLWSYERELLQETEYMIPGTASVSNLSWSRDGGTLLVTRVDDTFTTYTVEGSVLTSHVIDGISIHDAEWDPQHDRYALATGNGMIAIVLADGTSLMTLPGHTGRVSDVDWSPSGNHISSIAEDGTARCWNTETGKTVWIYVPAGAEQAVTLSAEGMLLSRLTGTPDAAFLFVGGTEGHQEVHPCQFGPEDMIWDAVPFSADETR